MVGYSQYDRLSLNQKLVAGCMAGCITRFLTQPMDIIKIRSQIQRRKKTPSLLQVFKEIYRQTGFLSLWTGHNLGQAHSIVSIGCQFYMFENTTKFVYTHFELAENQRAIVSFLCGIISGSCAVFLAHPIDVIRVKQIVDKARYKNMLSSINLIYRKEGFFAFYKGLLPSILQNGTAAGFQFSFFNVVQSGMFHIVLPKVLGQKHNDANPQANQVIIASTVAASTAAFLSKTLTYPFDLAKRRLQLSTVKKKTLPRSLGKVNTCKKLITCLMDAYRFGGLRGLFTGWKFSVYKTQVTSIIQFTAYEMICFTIGNLS